MVTHKTNPTGRSRGAVAYTGRARGWKPEAPFIAVPLTLIDCPSYRALTSPARRALDFLIREHLRHGGTQNGSLLAPYRQLQDWGISNRDVAPALRMLAAFGLIQRTRVGSRLGGKDGSATYALAWLPASGSLPTNAFKQVTMADIEAYISEQLLRRQQRQAHRGSIPNPVEI
ncbi:MAG TPA: hypothetical protein VHW60_18720 [Caulobacteraceae bacterium]|jgi:DNA-binding transcriptional MocR family regulator|nr:hypothetical protein [Caulobacteraceae bacterium]